MLSKYTTNKIQILSSWPFPDTEKEFRRTTTTKAISQERNNVATSLFFFWKSDTIMETKTVMDTDMVNINQETLFKKVEFPYVVPVEDLKHIHPYIKSLFCAIKNVEKLYRELKNSDKRHRNSVVSRKLYGIISLNSSIEKHPKLSQIKSGREDSSTEGTLRDF